jgi:purine-binding chemotaxis protein CheW
VSDVERLVCFFLDEQEYGVAIGEVKETIELRPITRVFLVPSFVAGLINLRGDVVAVIDLAVFLGLRHRAPTHDARIIILRGRSPGRPVSAGLLVDRLSEVRDVDPRTLRPPPSTVPAHAANFMKGIARIDDHPLMALELERVFESDQLKAFRRRA